MKALVYTGPSQMEMRGMPDPIPGADEALVRVDAVGICGSDMHAYLGHDDRRPAPLILGHEVAGTVLSGAMSGQRVTINPLVPCYKCGACKQGRTNLCPHRQIISMPPREGGFAEMLAMPERNLIPAPKELPISHASLVEPLAVCWHAVKLAAETMFGDIANARCVVIGGGAIGFGSALALKAFGVCDISIVESNPARATFLRTICDYPIITPGQADGDTTTPVELVIDAVGFRATRELACKIASPGSVICHVGLGDANDGVDVRRLTLQEITFVGTYTYTEAEFKETAQALADGKFGDINWIAERPLSEGAAAFAEIRAGEILAPKTVLIP